MPRDVHLNSSLSLNHPWSCVVVGVGSETFYQEATNAGGVSSYPKGHLVRGIRIQYPWWSLCGWAVVKSRYFRAGILRMRINVSMVPGAQDVPEQPRKLGSTGGWWSEGLRLHQWETTETWGFQALPEQPQQPEWSRLSQSSLKGCVVAKGQVVPGSQGDYNGPEQANLAWWLNHAWNQVEDDFKPCLRMSWGAWVVLEAREAQDFSEEIWWLGKMNDAD